MSCVVHQSVVATSSVISVIERARTRVETRSILPGSAIDHGDQEQGLDERHPPARVRDQVVRQQQRHGR